MSTLTSADQRQPVGHEVPFARTEITPEAQLAALEVLRSGWVTTGPLTATFEQELAAYLGARRVVAVSSCTAALELSLRALRLAPGSPVLTPSLTFCGAVQAIVLSGLRPVLVDIDADTLIPDARAVSTAAGRAERPAAMVVQHMAGFPAPVEELADAAGLSTARVVQDVAHGLGAEYQDGTAVGGGGRASCLSFYATKNLPIGEGGAIVTDDDELADLVSVTRLHGMSRDAWTRYLPGGARRYTVQESGLKANLTDVQAAIGSAQLTQLPRWQRRRAQVAARYQERLEGLPGIGLPAVPAAGRHAWHLFQVRIGPAFGRPRDETVDALAEQGIGTSVHFVPVHHMPYFQALLGPAECAAVPVTDRVFPELLSLPMHPGLTDDDVDRVCAVLTAVGRTDERTSSCR